MKIVVCVKQVPDSWADKALDPADKTLDRGSVDAVMNELDEYAVEEALRLQEAHGGEVIVLSMGPDQATDTIRKALSMGATAGVHVVDDALHGSDAVGTSLALAKAIEAQGADLVVFGSESTDARMSVLPAMVAEQLGMPQLTFSSTVSIEGDRIVIDGKPATSYTVKRDYVFGMGDNRDDSLDSRFWGFIPKESVVGTPMIVYWSWDPNVPLFNLFKKIGSIRLGRLATIIH